MTGRAVTAAQIVTEAVIAENRCGSKRFLILFIIYDSMTV